jgi:transposase
MVIEHATDADVWWMLTEGFSADEVAFALGVSRETAESWIARVRKRAA